jgi:hypothetical protein
LFSEKSEKRYEDSHRGTEDSEIKPEKVLYFAYKNSTSKIYSTETPNYNKNPGNTHLKSLILN